ncbi:DDE superfamily endonuclease [Nitzschia inconspicua]|uniref:DDE superfamily endonuclease n=1 Tax=Nitzschia inconspicua TaxID=303405 RepID=A0A9K3PGL6_9STRA|nr:DDE superfamily endonuclease [Nitzschia inconspicua]
MMTLVPRRRRPRRQQGDKVANSDDTSTNNNIVVDFQRESRWMTYRYDSDSTTSTSTSTSTPIPQLRRAGSSIYSSSVSLASLNDNVSDIEILTVSTKDELGTIPQLVVDEDWNQSTQQQQLLLLLPPKLLQGSISSNTTIATITKCSSLDVIFQTVLHQLQGLTDDFYQSGLPWSGPQCRSLFAGGTGVLYCLPALVCNNDRLEQGTWILQAVFSILADYVYIHGSSIFHGFDRYYATYNTIVTLWRATRQLHPFVLITAIIPIACFVLANRAKATVPAAATTKQEEEEEEKKKDWYQARLSRDRRYPRQSSKSYYESPFVHLFESGDDQALLDATGVDHFEFEKILSLFEPLFDKWTVDEETGEIVRKRNRSEGRRRSIDAKGALGLVLIWYRTNGAFNRTLCLCFGLPMTPMENWLKFAKRCLFKALREYAPKMPTEETTKQYMDAIGSRYTYIPKVAFAVDGWKFYIESPANDRKHDAFYNRWKHSHFISNFFAFAPDGSIPCAVLNAPGCLHDSTVADYGGMSEKLDAIYDNCGAMTVVDSTFRSGPGFLKPSKSDPIGDRHAYMVNEQAKSFRQFAERRMRQIKAKFPRMTDKLKLEDRDEHLLDTSLMIRLYNHQVKSVGMNRTLDTFMERTSGEDEECFDYEVTIAPTANDFILETIGNTP